MEQLIKFDLYKEFLNLEKKYVNRRHWENNHLQTLLTEQKTFVDKTVNVFNLLTKHPYLAGREVSERTGLKKHQLTIAYKMIQRSDICQKHFKKSNNQEYFNVVNHYFNHRLYTIVFFVGTSCPNRCIFCPSVEIDAQGRRRLIANQEAAQPTLSENQLVRIFDDIATIKARGTEILVKISGGLEPLTDIRTMEIITRLSKPLAVPVKLFTNGLLLDDPEKRKIALETSDIRIGLITSDEQQYNKVCFPEKLVKQNLSGLVQLKENIKNLVRERSEINPACRIGFNIVVLPENHTQLISLLQMAEELRIDYVNFKPDYFSTYAPEIVSAMEESVQEARLAAQFGPYESLYVNFTSSLSRKDLFWRPWQGTCDTLNQSDFRIFITPFGHLSPVHYGAFSHWQRNLQGNNNPYSIGKITNERGLLYLIEHPGSMPEIELKKLNPFELILSLEIMREEKDAQWGLPISASPYHTSLKEEFPADVFFDLHPAES